MVERHFHARVELAPFLKLMEEFKLIPVAVHVMHGGDAERIGMGNTLAQDSKIGVALCPCGRGLRIASGREAQRIAAACRCERENGIERRGLFEFTRGQTAAIQNNFIAHGKFRATHEARRFQGLCVGPDRMVVETTHDKGNVRHHGIEQQPRDRRIGAKLFVGRAHHMQHLRLPVLRAVFGHRGPHHIKPAHAENVEKRKFR